MAYLLGRVVLGLLRVLAHLAFLLLIRRWRRMSRWQRLCRRPRRLRRRPTSIMQMMHAHLQRRGGRRSGPTISSPRGTETSRPHAEA
ncbi:uncharacterized protein M6B38_169750 [Iris pallida]|uniref:Secreted protein n=1 Tax=Iris pallida TaxID=29817 RepID=A0AAX6EUX4_IRIPA|nr:uncharacterized protein M6B38_169750 [Iris pallida]